MFPQNRMVPTEPKVNVHTSFSLPFFLIFKSFLRGRGKKKNKTVETLKSLWNILASMKQSILARRSIPAGSNNYSSKEQVLEMQLAPQETQAKYLSILLACCLYENPPPGKPSQIHLAKWIHPPTIQSALGLVACAQETPESSSWLWLILSVILDKKDRVICDNFQGCSALIDSFASLASLKSRVDMKSSHMYEEKKIITKNVLIVLNQLF